LVLSACLAASPRDYEEMARQSAMSGNYAAAAQNYALAAEAYHRIGNNSAAAVNYERAASFYAAIGSQDLYRENAAKAAECYSLAAQDLLDQGEYWFSGNSYARSAAFYNATGHSQEYREAKVKAGESYQLAASHAENLSTRVAALYSACLAFFGVDRNRFEAARIEHGDAVAELISSARKSNDSSVFDVLDAYYLPLYTRVLRRNDLSGDKMKEVGDLARDMGLFGYAAAYYTSAATFYSSSGEKSKTLSALSLAEESYASRIEKYPRWNYTTYSAIRSDFENALYLSRYLNDTDEVGRIHGIVERRLRELASTLRDAAGSSAARGEFEEAAWNLSAAAEVLYVLGDEEGFLALNQNAAWNYLRAAEEIKEENSTTSADLYDQAGFLYRLAGNATASKAYLEAAKLYSSAGNSYVVSGNLTLAARYLYQAARDYRYAGQDGKSRTYYEKYISVLQRLIESNPESKGELLVSIGDAQRYMGDDASAEATYREASDELVKKFGHAISSNPQYFASSPSIAVSLAKAYRLSGQNFLARKLVEQMDQPSLLDVTKTLAIYAQTYRTAARIHRELARSDLSVFDFQSYAVNVLFQGICSLVARDLEQAQESLNSFESIYDPLHSSNRKFYRLLSDAVRWLRTGDRGSLKGAKETLAEIKTVGEETDTSFLLDDLLTALSTEAAPEDLERQGSSLEREKRWILAGDAFWKAGILYYFQEDFNRSKGAFEDSSYAYIQASDYEKAKRSARIANECTFEPSNFVLGLISLSEAYVQSNRTLAGAAKVSFRESLKQGYRPDRSRELMRLAARLEGMHWQALAFKASLLALVVIIAAASYLFLRGIRGDREKGRRT